jgi:glutamine cyclotransferase
VILAGSAILLLAGLVIWRQYEPETGPTDVPPDEDVFARQLRVRVVAQHPHDPEAFTQGLVLDGDKLYESVGRYGMSALREIDPRTGEERRRVELPTDIFAEGLALVDDRLIQISWREEKALVWNARTFEKVAEHGYTGEGWGLCYDGRRLVMSDGTGHLTFRDPRTFRAQGELQVTVDGEPADRLNELECARGKIYANVWTTEQILEIDPATGRATAVIDASGLTEGFSQEALENIDVLNGIAYDPRTQRFLITGKLWPQLFEVEFVE